MVVMNDAMYLNLDLHLPGLGKEHVTVTAKTRPQTLMVKSASGVEWPNDEEAEASGYNGKRVLSRGIEVTSGNIRYDFEKATARMEYGVLRLVLPMMGEEQKRRWKEERTRSEEKKEDKNKNNKKYRKKMKKMINKEKKAKTTFQIEVQ